MAKAEQSEEKPQQPQQRQISVDDSEVASSYSNFVRVIGTPEELIVDFGLNAQPMGANDRPVKINQRIALNFISAKRLLHALHASISRHEQVFGQIETDFQKRMINRDEQSEKSGA